MKDRIVFIVGPTAVGKSEIAVVLAKKIKAEIISCDSMQLYEKMDVITSKPPDALKKSVPHHLIDVIPVNKEYNVSKYYNDAVCQVKAILKRGRTPLIAGGTGLYMSVLVDGLFKNKASSETVRKHFYGQAEENGSEHLYNKLKAVDPEAALKIHPNDTKRIVRALEVFEITGEPISKLQKQRRGLSQIYDIKIFGLNMPREELYKRIEKRVDRMFAEGLLNEVKQLLKLKLSKTANYAIGIRELKGYFDGLYDLEEAKRLIKKNTRQYAKRQMTWFRKDKRIHWVEIREGEGPKGIAGKIWKELCL